MASANELLIKINGDAKNFLKEIDSIKKKTEALNKVFGAIAKAGAAAFAGFTAAIAGTTKIYADYETALVGVGKTTDITGKDLTKLGKRISDLSRTIPLSTNELLGMAQAAGQLGVKGEENLVKFTDTVARLGVATDLTGEQAAVSLARILTVTKEGVGNIDRFGSVIVRLGNNFAATESEIVKMTNEVARSVSIFGVSSTQAAGLSTALKAIGVRAELGGSAMGRAFRAISDAVNFGGKKLEAFRALTGKTGEDLKRIFEEDATAAFQLFAESLGDLPAAEITKELAKFGLKGEEILKVLPNLALNSDLLSRALNTASKEFKDNTALMNESKAAFDTLNSETTLLKNEITAFAREIGAKLAPEIRNLVTGVRETVRFFTDMDESTKQSIATFLKWGAIISAAVAAIATLAAGIATAVAAFGAISLAAAPVIAFFGGIAAPVLIATAAVAALSLGINSLFLAGGDDKTKNSLEELNEEIAKLTRSQKELSKAMDNTTLIGREKVLFLAANKEKIAGLERQIKKLKELKKTAKDTAGEFSDGSFLFRPPENADFSLTPPGLEDLPEQDVNAPLAINPEIREQEVKAEQTKLAAAKAAEEEKKRLQEKAKNDRLAGVRDEQEKIKIATDLFNDTQIDAFDKKENAILTKQAEFDIKKLELAAEKRAAQEITDEDEKAIALENVALKNALLLEQQVEFNAKSEEIRAEEQERKVALDEELRALDIEQQAALNDEDLETLRNKLLTEDEVKRKVAKDQALRNIKARNKELEDTEKHGATIATLNKFFASEEITGLKRSTSDLQELRNSSNKTQKRIGKAAAHANAAIKTAEGAISAYTSFASIPILGVPLGIAAAAALTAYGIEQQQKISSAQRGGVVQDVPGGGGARDRVPALLEPGELVVPRALSPDFIQSVGRPEVGAETGGQNFSVEIALRDELLDFVDDGLNERRALNITNEGIQ